jgi:uncharacterized membrane protein
VLDLTSPRAGAKAAQRLVGLGIVGAIPAALAGLSDWSATEPGPARRVGLVHAAAMDVAVVLSWKSWRQRHRGQHARAALTSTLSAGCVAFGGWLGGQLAYHLGVGVQPPAYPVGPTEVPAPVQVRAG